LIDGCTSDYFQLVQNPIILWHRIRTAHNALPKLKWKINGA